jgi:hypothetical protein
MNRDESKGGGKECDNRLQLQAAGPGKPAACKRATCDRIRLMYKPNLNLGRLNEKSLKNRAFLLSDFSL